VRRGGADVEPGIGLVLDGEGFRAALFHGGALRRLNELRCLPRLSRVSSVSGGSIVAGLLGVRWADLAVANLDEQVIEPLRAFCERPIGHGLARRAPGTTAPG
jgi:NTE family protein